VTEEALARASAAFSKRRLTQQAEDSTSDVTVCRPSCHRKFRKFRGPTCSLLISTHDGGDSVPRRAWEEVESKL
jgi:hypothetical protein